MNGEPSRNLWRDHVLLLLLPAYLITAAFVLRSGAGPFWQWNLLDPAYFYLFDSLNLVVGNAPGHVGHPGVPVYSLGALLIGLLHIGDPADAIVAAVFADPEIPLRWMSTLFILLSGLATWGLGWIARRAFGTILPAVACQTAPIVSTIILKHLFVPRPESIIAFSTLLLLSVTVAALRPGTTESRPRTYGLAFGMIAGFGVATKLTFAPLCLLPLMLPGGRRVAIPYLVTAGLAFLVFMLPAIGVWGDFVDWMTRVFLSSGAYDSGSGLIIDPQAYSKAFMKILKRPSLRVPMALALVTLALVYWRQRGGAEVDRREAQALLALTATQLAQVIVVAKQPVAFYMIPSYMLSALSVLLSARLLWGAAAEKWDLRVSGHTIGAGVLIIAVSAQVAGTVRLNGLLTERAARATSIDGDNFDRCARVYICSASHPAYAMSLADRVTGFKHTDRLKTVINPDDFWIDDWNQKRPPVLRNSEGPTAVSTLRQAYPCIFFRGNRVSALPKFLAREAPDLDYAKTCSTGDEPVLTAGVDCRGR